VLAEAFPATSTVRSSWRWRTRSAARSDEQRALLVEAGTGTGKTLAYLVPAILSQKRIVISTGTRHLQEQIHDKDIPLPARHPRPAGGGGDAEGHLQLPVPPPLRRAGPTRRSGSGADLEVGRRHKSGDRAELAAVPDESPAWQPVTTTPDARLGPRCPFFERCFVTQARGARGQGADRDRQPPPLLRRPGAARGLPGRRGAAAYDAVIFDEAHQIEDVATEHFGLGVSTLRLLSLVRDAQEGAHPPRPKATPEQNADARAAALMIANLEQRGENLFAAMRARLLDAGAQNDVRMALPADLFDEGGAGATPGSSSTPRSRSSAAHADRRALDLARDPDAEDDDHEDAAAVRAARAHLPRRSERARRRRHRRGAPPRALGRGARQARAPARLAHRRGAAPARVGAGRVESAVFTSATLTAGGDFVYARERLGLPEDDAEALAVDSPFDYGQQAMLYLPRDLPAPQEPGFADAAIRAHRRAVRDHRGRAFVLYTSHRALRHAAAALRPKLPFPCWCRARRRRAALLDQFRATPGAVLLATSSFWEGVDVPGDALSLVVIEKLPFSAPDDPITAARVDR
jgi:ATP-dependent DNA helicase DinG